MNFNNLLDHIKEKLNQPLPGISAHVKLAPYRKNTLNTNFSKYNPKLASTLLLLYESRSIIKFILIQRPDYSGTHGGQISFPGGKKENGETLKETAIRETVEEIGVPYKDIQILGKLSQVYVPPSNFLINPFIGYLNKTPIFNPDPKEVTMVLEIEIDELMKKDVIKEKLITVGEKTKNPMKINVPYFDLHCQTVWGATGVILSEFKDIIS